MTDGILGPQKTELEIVLLFHESWFKVTADIISPDYSPN
jgi:hypothetical protein